jgi:hypothetical protein
MTVEGPRGMCPADAVNVPGATDVASKDELFKDVDYL